MKDNDKHKIMYQIQLMDGNCSPICDGVTMAFVDSLEDFEKNWIPLMNHDKERVKRYFKSKNGEIITDYWSDDPELNIVQAKLFKLLKEKEYKEMDVTKEVVNIYGFASTYHIDEIKYYIRYLYNPETKGYLKLGRCDIKGICYDTGKSCWGGVECEKYEKIGYEECKRQGLFSPKYKFNYVIEKDDKRLAIYIPRYHDASVYGNEFITLSSDDEMIGSDDTSDFSDITANLFVWKIIKTFESYEKMKKNWEHGHYKFGKLETQFLLEDFPGEAG